MYRSATSEYECNMTFASIPEYSQHKEREEEKQDEEEEIKGETRATFALNLKYFAKLDSGTKTVTIRSQQTRRWAKLLHLVMPAVRTLW